MSIEAKLSTAFVNKCFELCRGYPTHKSFQVREKDTVKKIEPGVRAWHIRHKRWVDVVASMGCMLRVQWCDFVISDDKQKYIRVYKSSICLQSDLILPYGKCTVQKNWYVNSDNHQSCVLIKTTTAYSLLFLRPAPSYRSIWPKK